jgi:hypothetical protein
MSSGDSTLGIELEFHFIVPARVIYDTLINPMYSYLNLLIFPARMILQFTQNPATSEPI